MAKLYPYSAHTCSLGKSGGFLDGSSETTNSQFSHSSLAPAIVFKGLVFDSVPHSFQGAIQKVGLLNYGHTRELPGVALVNCTISHIFTII